MAAILVCIPIKPSLNPVLRAKCFDLAQAMVGANPGHSLQFLFDCRPVEASSADYTPWSRVWRARNAMLDEIDLWRHDYLLWIDADVVSYPPDMPSRLIAANPSGVTAPMVLIESSNRFYDFAAFIIKGCDSIDPTNRDRTPFRNLQHEWPYWPQQPTATNVEMDCVGTITMVPAGLYRNGARYEDHPAFTDHYPLCKACRDADGAVIVCRDVVALHADLPKYGEKWH